MRISSVPCFFDRRDRAFQIGLAHVHMHHHPYGTRTEFRTKDLNLPQFTEELGSTHSVRKFEDDYVRLHRQNFLHRRDLEKGRSKQSGLRMVVPKSCYMMVQRI